MVVAKQKKAVQKKPGGKQAAKVGRGTAKLKEAADKAIGEKFQQITDKLVEKTIAGNNTSAMLLFKLAEGSDEGEEETVTERRPSAAEELASEPEWKGEPEETEAEDAPTRGGAEG